MSPVTHFLVGWLAANAADLDQRDRVLVAIAGVIPDVDGLGIVAEVVTRNSAHPPAWWSLNWKRGFSPLEMISRRADRAMVKALRRRFPRPTAAPRPEGHR